MKICYVCDTLPFTHHNYSGAEITCASVSQTTKELGYEIFYITSKIDFKDTDDKLYCLPSSHSKNFPIDIHIIIRLINILKNEKPDIIHLYTKQYLLPSIIASHLNNIKMIYSVVDYHMICPNNILINKQKTTCKNYLDGYNCSNCYYSRYSFPINRMLSEIHHSIFKWFHHHTDMFLTFTEESKWRLMDYGIPKEKIEYVYQYCMPEIQKTCRLLLHPMVTFVGSFHPHKGLDTIIKAFKQLLDVKPYIHLYIVGGGNLDYKKRIVELIGNDDMNIHLLGKINHNETLSIIQQSDLVVVNEKWYSDFGNVVVIESLLLGTPVVCGNMGTGSIFVDKYNGGFWAYSFKPNDFADKIIKGLDIKKTGEPYMVLPDLKTEIRKIYEKVMR